MTNTSDQHYNDNTRKQPPESEVQTDTTDTENAALETLRSELAQLRADTLLQRADLENQRKRLTRDIEIARKFANEQLLAELLAVFDSMEAGLASAAETDPLREGLELTLRQLHRIAENNGLTEISPNTGDTFDPERHQAMSTVDAASVAPGAITQMMQKGYLLNERLLRPALVVVAKHP